MSDASSAGSSISKPEVVQRDSTPLNKRRSISTAEANEQDFECINLESCGDDMEVDLGATEHNGKEIILKWEMDLEVTSLDQFVDCTDAFTTKEIFSNRDDLINWVKKVAKENGFVIVIMRSELPRPGKKGRSAFVTLGCERSGKYRKNINPKISEKLKRVRTGSKKCNCPFKIKGVSRKHGTEWMVKVACGLHNHQREDQVKGNSAAGRLSEEELNLLANMTCNLVKPRDILLTLKQNDQSNASTLRHIYNARQKYRRIQKESVSKLQELKKLLDNSNYMEWHRKNEVTDTVKDLLWAHPKSIDLLNAFPNVLLIDSTYKKNRYGHPLLEIVGVTSTGKTFTVAFVYMEAEETDIYIWALNIVKGLMTNVDGLPHVIVTDNDTTLMNAIKCVFPSAINLLCRVQINKSIEAKCKFLVLSKERFESMILSWIKIVTSSDAGMYKRHWSLFQADFENFPEVINYVRDTWLIPHKERFISAWTDKVLHFGNTTTTRAEGVHARLKKMLQYSQGDFCVCWENIDKLIELQHSDIMVSFEESMAVVGSKFNTKFFDKLRGLVSKDALKRIMDESERVAEVGINRSLCGCINKTTYGLSCAHELVDFIRLGWPIPLDSVHPHWRKLDLDKGAMKEVSSELSISHELEAIQRRFNECDLAGKIAIKKKLQEIAYPDTTSMFPPLENVRTTNRPLSKFERSSKQVPPCFEHFDSIHGSALTLSTCDSVKEAKRRKVLYIDCLPSEIHKYIDNIVDVKADGHCGFRAIAALIGMGEDSWAQVRLDLIKELKTCRQDYIQMFGSEKRVNELIQSLYSDYSFAPPEKWMSIPDMGHLIASRYNIVLVHLSMQICLTFFPLRGAPPSPINQKIIAIGFVNNCHFVQVFMNQRSPIPPVALQWTQYCDDNARAWEVPYVVRMKIFKGLFPSDSDVATKETIHSDQL